MSIKRINVKDLLDYEGKEGLILQGCGGDPQEWVDGINEMLTKQAYFEDGCIKVRILDEDDLDIFDDEDEDDEFEDCIGCPYFCEECGTCTYDE